MRIEGIKRFLFRFRTPRTIIQFISFIFFSAIIFNLGVLPFLLPVLWTWGLPQNTVGDAFTAIQLTFYNGVFPWLAFTSFLITGILVGKALCGWICPFGFIQDLTMHIKRRKTEAAPRTHDMMLYIKYVGLALILFISITFAISKTMGGSSSYENALGIFVKAPFTSLSPAQTLFSILPTMALNLKNAIGVTALPDIIAGVGKLTALFWAQIVFLIIVLAVIVYTPRGFCRYLCPHGAIMAIMNRFSFIGLRREPAKCARIGCGKCVEACPTRVPIMDLPWEKFSHPECIYCMKCADACENKAIKLTYP
jgi:ferredoxin-type protein NapH